MFFINMNFYGNTATKVAKPLWFGRIEAEIFKR